MEMVTDFRKKRMATGPMSIPGGGGDLGCEGGGGQWVPGCYHTSTERTREGADPISWGSWGPTTCAATLNTGSLWPVHVSLPQFVGGFVLRFFAMLSLLLWHALITLFHNWGLELHKPPCFSFTASWPPVVFQLALCVPIPPRFLQLSAWLTAYMLFQWFTSTATAVASTSNVSLLLFVQLCILLLFLFFSVRRHVWCFVSAAARAIHFLTNGWKGMGPLVYHPS